MYSYRKMILRSQILESPGIVSGLLDHNMMQFCMSQAHSGGILMYKCKNLMKIFRSQS